MSKLFSKICCAIGRPAAITTLSFVKSIVSEKINPFALILKCPLVLITLPLLPFAFLGERSLNNSVKNDFNCRTKDLPKVMLPKHYLWIDNYNNSYQVEPLFSDGEEDHFDNEEGARLFIKSIGYKEVVSIDCNRLKTFWIK